jgi:hypothetical protein
MFTRFLLLTSSLSRARRDIDDAPERPPCRPSFSPMCYPRCQAFVTDLPPQLPPLPSKLVHRFAAIELPPSQRQCVGVALPLVLRLAPSRGISESSSGRCYRCRTRSRGALTRSVPSRKFSARLRSSALALTLSMPCLEIGD